jgi:hypothetical protein
VDVWTRGLAYLAVVALGCGSCGDSQDPAADPADGGLTMTQPSAGDVAVADLTAFSEAVAHSPRWAVARRFGPAPFESQLAETRGAVEGKVVGLQAGPRVETTSEKALGFEDPVDADTHLVLQDAHLLVEVSGTVGAGAAGIERGAVVAVPIPIWLSGSAGLTDDDFAAPVVDLLEETVPLDARTVVLIQAVDQTSDTPLLDLAGESDWNSLSAVVFEAEDGTLFGLDYVIQTAAAEHYGVGTLEELAARAAHAG